MSGCVNVLGEEKEGNKMLQSKNDESQGSQPTSDSTEYPWILYRQGFFFSWFHAVHKYTAEQTAFSLFSAWLLLALVSLQEESAGSKLAAETGRGIFFFCGFCNKLPS